MNETREQSLFDDTNSKMAKAESCEPISEQNGKRIYLSDNPDYVVCNFKSNQVEEDKGRDQIQEIDKLRNEMSCYLLEYVEGFHIPTHFVRKLSDLEMMVKRTELIPLTVKVFNSLNGMLTKRFGLKDSMSIEFPIIEHYFNHNSSLVNEYHVYAFAIATPEEFKQINRIASKVNAVLRGLCDRRQLMLADLQLGFGRCKGQIVLSDELSPVTCHFLDMGEESKAKRDKFNLDRSSAVETIRGLCNRLMLKV